MTGSERLMVVVRELQSDWNVLGGMRLDDVAWLLSANRPDKERKPKTEQHEKDYENNRLSLLILAHV